MKPIPIVLFCMSSFFGLTQTNPISTSKHYDLGSGIETPTNLTRYTNDYELKDYVFTGDSSILYTLNIDAIEQVRLQDLDIEIFDYENNVTIVLYSRERVTAIKKSAKDHGVQQTLDQ